jgi:hypothetical protein
MTKNSNEDWNNVISIRLILKFSLLFGVETDGKLIRKKVVEVIKPRMGQMFGRKGVIPI